MTEQTFGNLAWRVMLDAARLEYGSSQEELPEDMICRSIWVPEGYEMYDESPGLSMAMTICYNEQGDTFCFLTYGSKEPMSLNVVMEEGDTEKWVLVAGKPVVLHLSGSGGTSILIRTDGEKRLTFLLTGLEARRVLVGGLPAELYLGTDGTNRLFWAVGEDHYWITGPIPAGELIQIAESVGETRLQAMKCPHMRKEGSALTDQALEKLARQAMLDAARLEHDGLLEEPPEHTFSQNFGQRMKKLLRRGNHPLRHQIFHAAACLLLALLLSGGAVLAVVPEARVAFAGWVRETYEAYFLCRFFEEKEVPAADTGVIYRPAYVPSGYQVIHRSVEAGRLSITYKSDSGKTAAFSYFGDTPSSVLQVGRDRTETYKRVFVNGVSADLYLDRDEESNILVWMDEEAGAAFRISAAFDEAELIKMAESVEAVSRHAVYRPSWLPEGYEIYERYGTGKDVILSMIYENQKSHLLLFFRWLDYDSGKVYLKPAESSVEKHVFVGEHPADLYLSTKAEALSELVWADPEAEAFFYVAGVLPEEELLKVAESVQRMPPIQETDRPT